MKKKSLSNPKFNCTLIVEKENQIIRLVTLQLLGTPSEWQWMDSNNSLVCRTFSELAYIEFPTRECLRDSYVLLSSYQSNLHSGHTQVTSKMFRHSCKLKGLALETTKQPAYISICPSQTSLLISSV